MVHFHVITLFPDVCKTYTDSSVLGRAQKTRKGVGAKVQGKKIAIQFYNPRDYSNNKHRKVDDRPYGGGPGMVMQAEPILKAWQNAVGRKKGRVKTILLSPRGQAFTQVTAKHYAEHYDHIVLISGRYEGIDARVKKILDAEEVSVGQYVLTGGELPALTIIDAVSRHLQGVLGTYESLEENRVASSDTYTRPEVLTFKNKQYKVPRVLIEGHHEKINAYRVRQSIRSRK